MGCRGIVPTGLATVLAMTGCMGAREVLLNKVAPEHAIGPVIAGPRNTLLTVGGTVQLTMSAVSLTGAPVTTFDSVVYRLGNVGDSASIRVSSTGLVTGVAPIGNALPVNVLVYLNGTCNGDQLLITVTAGAVPGLTLSIQPPVGDSAKQSIGLAKTIIPVLRNPTTGQSLTGVQLQYAVQSQDQDRLGVFTGAISLNSAAGAASVHLPKSPSAARNQILPYVGEGSVWVYAALNAYGTLLQDSVQYSFTYPYTGTVAISKSSLAVLIAINGGIGLAVPSLPAFTLAPAGIVTFTNNAPLNDPLTVAYIFDNPAAATAPSLASTVGGASGNVSALAAQTSSRRQFLTAGTYRWTMTTSGGTAPWSGQTATGTIIVK